MKISGWEYKITKSRGTEKPTQDIKTASEDPNQPAHTRSIISILTVRMRLWVIGRWRRVQSRPYLAARIRRLTRVYIECKRYPEGPAVTRLYIISRLARQNYWINVDAQYYYIKRDNRNKQYLPVYLISYSNFESMPFGWSVSSLWIQ